MKLYKLLTSVLVAFRHKRLSPLNYVDTNDLIETVNQLKRVNIKQMIALGYGASNITSGAPVYDRLSPLKLATILVTILETLHCFAEK